MGQNELPIVVLEAFHIAQILANMSLEQFVWEFEQVKGHSEIIYAMVLERDAQSHIEELFDNSCQLLSSN